MPLICKEGVAPQAASHVRLLASRLKCDINKQEE